MNSAPGQPQLSDSSAPFGEEKTYSCCSLPYYQQMFDVDGDVLIKRILKSLSFGTVTFLDDTRKEKADLYGPLWITTTLVFLLAVCGNLADYIANGTPHGDSTDPSKQWNYDFTKVTLAATTFYLVLFIFPLIWFFALQCLNASRPFTTLVAYYGYSFTVYIPACLLCIIPYTLARIIVVSYAFAASTTFLLRNLYSSFLLPTAVVPNQETAAAHKKTGLLLILGAAIVHFGIAALTYFYFFNYKTKSSDETPKEV